MPPSREWSTAAGGSPACYRLAVDPALIPDDLAPGDRSVLSRDWSDLAVHRVVSPRDPDLRLAYDELWREFGLGGGMAPPRVIDERLAWDPAAPVRGLALAYELVVLRRAGAVAAIRDHTAVVRLDAAGRPRPGPVVVHLSHAWVEPTQRGSGIAAWLRALP